MKILFTFTGFNDPCSASVIEDAKRPGPILSKLASRSFDLVVFFVRLNTEERTRQPAALMPDPETLVRFVAIPDPTNCGDILCAPGRQCSGIRQRFEDAELNVPQSVHVAARLRKAVVADALSNRIRSRSLGLRTSPATPCNLLA